MRNLSLRILVAVVGFAAFGVAAKAQVPDQITVKIPFEFVIAGKTLPAGTYRVSRVAGRVDEQALVLSSFENRASVFILPTDVESNHADKVQVSFEEVGGEHFLSKIETADHSFTIRVPRSEILEAAARSHGSTPASGSSSGSN
jgi:hypothetical protein